MDFILVAFPIFIIFMLVLAFVTSIVIPYVQYKESSYYESTHRNFFSLRNDSGAYGEYLSYSKLRAFEKNGAKFLFNCYLPKDNGETTEIDMLMIHSSGIYVFESKNYSGWIFGSEYNKNWTQTLPNGRRSSKEYFLNPIMQNKAHIQWLESVIGEKYPIYSIIVFSERCELKQLDITSSDIYVLKRQSLNACVTDIDAKVGYSLSNEAVADIYNRLYPYTQVPAAEKAKHIQDIYNNRIKMEEHNTPISAPDGSLTCPWCGGKLVLRTTQKGPYAGSQFYGCSNYPKCKFIKKQ